MGKDGFVTLDGLWSDLQSVGASAGLRAWRPREDVVGDVAALTDVGKIRTNNEDSHAAWKYFSGTSSSPVTVLIVADGVGGEEAGEVASSIAVQSISRDIFREADAWTTAVSVVEDIGFRAAAMNTDDLFQKSAGGFIEEALRESLQKANREARRAAQEAGLADRSAATVVVAVLHERTLYTANLGDSRAYALTGAGLRQVTDDHSLVEELARMNRLDRADIRHHPMRHVVTRVVGKEEIVDPDVKRLRLDPGDIILLCTDGLTDMLEDTMIEKLIRRHTGVIDQGRALIAAALEAGGRDNVTVVLGRVSDASPARRPGLALCHAGQYRYYSMEDAD